ncbi:MAG: DUF1624 domain-containing protein [Oscillospiraceae bacterium]|nr:DUF1624 domain-containing protein [Oscillospiraceae bacterium]
MLLNLIKTAVKPIETTYRSKNSIAAKKSRIAPLDFIRGAAITVMVIFHLFFTFGEVFGFSSFLWLYEFIASTAIVDVFAGLFIIISGISSSLTKSNLRRGFKTLGIAVAITLVTVYLMPLLGYDNLGISFGILHLLSLAMLLSPLLLKLADQVPPQVAVPLCTLLFALTRNIREGYIGITKECANVIIPQSVREIPFLFPFGITNDSFFSADHYPLLPWIFLFIIGIYLGKHLRYAILPEKFYKTICKPVEAIGRHTLYIYVAHQPVIFFLGLVIEKLFLKK